MLDLPKSTVYNRRIPKQKFYDNLSVNAELKHVFVEQIALITWSNKIAPSTVHVEEGETVKEVEVMELKLNQRSLDSRVLRQIDKEIPYHILFLLEYQGEVQAWIGYKEQSQTSTNFKPGTYFHTDWTTPDALTMRITGLNMDAVYEGLIRLIAGERLTSDTSEDIKDTIARDEKRCKLEKEITVLENKVRREKQFNKQMELNTELKLLKQELDRIT
ncbi:MAG: DUF4391 domain-containing protein [Eubacteriales bacterium]